MGVVTGRAAEAPAPADDAKIVHALNRLGYGPRPGDVERVKQMGLDAYVRQQLRPESIPDPVVDKALAPLDTLRMPTDKLIVSFYEDIKLFIEYQMANGGYTDEMKMRFGVDLNKNKGDKDKPAGQQKDAAAPAGGAMMGGAAKAEKGKLPNLWALTTRDSIRSIGEMQQAKLIRATLSERQLQEVMADFWLNHFNVDVRKNAGRAFMVAYDRDVIRPRALGKFRDLLGAVAESPAMLGYLDNNENSVARKRSKFERGIAEWYIGYKLGMSVEGTIPEGEGPNENYGRELLELHTLGVDGGYSQKDVQEVARCFSGWNYSPLNGTFNFEAHRHDQGEKVVLGQRIAPKGGINDGRRVLDLLATHPNTAKFISRKLCQRFVADDPPSSLVERAAKVFTETDGDLRRVVETIVTSDEFYAPAAQRAKIKSPLEYAASSLRATGGTFADPGMFGKLKFVGEGGALIGNDLNASKAKQKSLARFVHDMGQPLFAHAAPTGYPEQSTKWVSPGALIDRLNFAVALSEKDVNDVKVDVKKLAAGVDPKDAEAVVDRIAARVLQGPLSPAAKRTVLATLKDQGGEGKPVDVKKAAALILGSPDFQRR
ncbi:MAG TPA: DUF1800 domain-containing protein [Humisphaera sp.]